MRVIKSRRKIVGACSTCGGEEMCIQGFGGENLRERDHLEDPDIEGSIILRQILLHGVSKYIFLPFKL